MIKQLLNKYLSICMYVPDYNVVSSFKTHQFTVAMVMCAPEGGTLDIY